jgi:hypothetical protein
MIKNTDERGIMNCAYSWGEPIKKRRRPHKDVTYTTVYPSNKIKQLKF